jgi:ATP-binding cassette, subfamily G (WHITE), member 1
MSLLKINEILEMLGMIETKDSFSYNLSGGQQKRLSIALELVDNPRVIFFDEPTTGLDSSSSTQCMQLLKKLADHGRTIICTVHQPSPLVFKQFDLVYAIAEGQCIYSGSNENLVPFLFDLELPCPETYNPSDYLLEIATHTYDIQNEKLREKIQDGKNQNFRKEPIIETQQKNLTQMKHHEVNPISICVKKARFSSKLSIFDPKNYCNDADLYSTSFLRQFYYLLVRSFLLISRNPSLCLIRVSIHFIVAIFIGILYQGVGNSAKNQMNNFKYVFYSVMFLMFTAFSSFQIQCKLSY